MSTSASISSRQADKSRRYRHHAYSLTDVAATLLTRLNSINNHVALLLSSTRNRLLNMEITIAFATLGTSIGAFIGAMFGMNLTSGKSDAVSDCRPSADRIYRPGGSALYVQRDGRPFYRLAFASHPCRQTSFGQSQIGEGRAARHSAEAHSRTQACPTTSSKHSKFAVV